MVPSQKLSIFPKKFKIFLVLDTNIFHKTKVSTAVLILNILFYIKI